MPLEGQGYSRSKCEISLENKVFTSLVISHNQSLEEGVSEGTSGKPLRRTGGKLNMGEGTLAWSDLGESDQFLALLTSGGEGFCQKEFKATITYTAKGRPTLRHTLFQCRLLDYEVEVPDGEDPIGPSMPFTFMEREINGKKAVIE